MKNGLVVTAALSASMIVGYFCGEAFGIAGVLVSIPVGILLGWAAGQYVTRPRY